MAKLRFIRLLHLIGYATTLIVVCELAAAGYLGYGWWRSGQQLRSRLLEATRTHNRPLIEASGELLAAEAAKSLASVRQTTGRSKNVLSYVAMPSFSYWYAMALYLPDNEEFAQVALTAVR